MSEIKKIEEEYDIKILELLELEEKEYENLKKMRLKVEKKEILERIYVKDIHSQIKELKEIETKLEELETKILRKRYKNEIKDLKMLIQQEIELGTKSKKTEDKIKECRIRIDIIISGAEDLRLIKKIILIILINKLNELRKIRTNINELEKEKDLDCINMMQILNEYE